jgi:osmoprotectant transport system permease protein
VALVLALLAALGLYAFASAAVRFGDAGAPIRVGAKTFTEQYILADLLADHLRDRTGLATEPVPSLGSTVAFDALRSGEIDVYVDYSGTLWATILKRPAPPPSRAACIEEVKDHLAREDGIELVAPLGFENAYALAMRKAQADRLGIQTISDLVPHAAAWTIGSDYEFLSRPEWRAVVAAYGLRFAAERSMDPALMYQAAEQGDVDVISAFTTDGRVDASGLVLLADDRHAIPPYDAVILAGPRLARDHPDAIAVLRGLGGAITADAMREMNYAVDARGEDPAAVARRFLAGLDERGAVRR